MARVYHMTWIPSRRGWMKEYRGRKYAVSCRQLGTPETKDGSYQAANAWWEAKRLETDSTARARLPAPRTPAPMEDIVSALYGDGTSSDWHQQFRAFMERFAEAIQGVFPSGPLPQEPTDSAVWTEGAETARRTALRDLLTRIIVDGEAVPEQVAERLPPARVFQLEHAVKGLRGESAASADQTVKAHADAWLKTLEARVAAGNLTPDRCTNVRMCLAHFTGFFGETACVDTIDADKLDAFYRHCLGRVAARRQDGKTGWSVAYAKETFAIARTWIRWLWERGAIEPPRNIDSRGFKFGSSAKKVPTWTPEEYRHVVAEAPGKLKLALLLMGNCGMTQQDISDLRDDEVDWQAGRIIRKRSKTAGIDGVPVVNYKLWPATFKLLKKYRSGAERVLLTESGKPYVRKELVNGKLVKADGFISNFAHLKRRLKFKKPMKQVRKMSATLLESHETYGRVTALFLGHAPRSMKDRHYAAPSQELLDSAVLWIGKQMGMGGKPAPGS